MSLRKLLVVATVVATMCAGVAQATPVELAVNGGFETGDFTGWSLFPTGPNQFSIVSPGATSTYAGCITNAQEASAALFKNANIGVGVVLPGIPVTISFDAKGTLGVGAVAFAEFFSEIAGGGVSSSVILGGGPLNINPNTWTHFAFTTTTGPNVSGGVTVQLTATTAAIVGSTAQVCYDNVSVTVDSSVPAESTTLSEIKHDFR